MLTLLGEALGAFVITNIDGLVLLTALFAVRPRRAQPIVGGQYLGLAVLVAASVVAALGLVVIPTRWTGLLGVVPLVLGIRGLLTPVDHVDTPTRITIWTVTTLIITNGADNLSVYIPLFRRLGVGASLYSVAVFAVLAGVWCVAASLLGSHNLITSAVERWEAKLVPIIFIVVGSLLLLSTLAR
jgi:cadmium resistance protein CadD (predicted permease)